MLDLTTLGWCDFFENQLKELSPQDLIPARVIEEHRGMYRVACHHGVLWGEVSGKFLHEARASTGLPVVGDWLLIAPDLNTGKSMIHRMLDRKTTLSRKAAGTAKKEQMVASNVEVAFVVSSLKQEINLNRLERYLVLIKERGIEPVILLTKADLCQPEDIDHQLKSITSVARDTKIYVTSAKEKHGLNFILQSLSGSKTGVLLGLSGAGKSTLINALIDEHQPLQRVSAVRESDESGRHTTTSRRLISLSHLGHNAMIIDTPGVRELQIWEKTEGVEAEFDDIETLALQCKFNNCSHLSEPGCKIQMALKDGSLEFRRVQNYIKLLREQTLQSKIYKKPRTL